MTDTLSAPASTPEEKMDVDMKEEEVGDPLLTQYSDVVKEGDHVLLLFNNGHQIFAHALKQWRGKTAPVKINKRTYSTANLIGLAFGSVLELGPKGLIPLPLGEDVVPKQSTVKSLLTSDSANNSDSNDEKDINTMSNDNRDLVDNNVSQSITQPELHQMQKDGAHGSEIVAALISNSSTFHTKSQFSQDKYIRKKQQKYQLRCRMVRPTASNICQTYFLKDAKRIMNCREDTLAQILSYANVYAGCQVLVMEECMGILTGALAQRMGGYGAILSVFLGNGPSYLDLLGKFNLSFAENQSIKWIHSGEVFGEGVECGKPGDDVNKKDWEAHDRDVIKWPCPLKAHTLNFLTNMKTDKERYEFLNKRVNRFSRKITRPTSMENRSYLHKQSDSLIIATKYNPKATLFHMLPFLAPSCPFVVLCEHMEPLLECFTELQKEKIAINLRLSDTWMREFQMLPGRTHPNMNMGQTGGYLLTGVKICPTHGINELDEETEKRIKAEIGGRRGKKKDKSTKAGDNHTKRKDTQEKDKSGESNAKRKKVE